MAAYMKMDAISKGESLAEGHLGSSGWIEIGSVNFSSGREISTPTGSASKREASAPTVSEVRVTKLMDSTSPLIFQESLIGKKGAVQIDLTETGSDQLETFCTLKLTDTLVASYTCNSGGGRPVETITLNFTKIEYSYQGYDDTGSPASDKKQAGTYNLTTVQNK